MSSTLGFIRNTTVSLVLSVAILSLISGEANAQYPGYGWGYDLPDNVFGGFVGPFNYGTTGFDYGMSGFADPGAASGFNYGVGMGGLDYGLSAFGFANYGTAGGQAYGGGQGYGYGGTATAFPYMNSLFGVGMTGPGNQGFVDESNRSVRGQTAAERRAKARKLQQQRGR